MKIRISIETCRKIVRKYSRKGDIGDSVAFVRALEDATRGVALLPEDYMKIAEEVKLNFAKRMAKRAGK